MDIVRKRKSILLAAVIYSLIAAVLTLVLGLKSGIEFSSGSMLTLKFENPVEQSELKLTLSELGYGEAIVQRTGGGDFIIRVHELTSEVKTNLEGILQEKFGKLTEVEFNSVSPMIATETARNAAIAVAVASVGILLYIAWAFRKMPRPFICGVSAIIALIHDSLVSVAFFAVMGRFLSWEINLMFITGVLAVIGYSVNNTVVVFDRIRENLTLGTGINFGTTVNNSLLETFGRCLNTTITTLIAVLAILIFVGAVIRNFAVVLLVGLVAGTFSSSFIAPLLLVTWEKGKQS